jgi:hypothetical protein
MRRTRVAPLLIVCGVALITLCLAAGVATAKSKHPKTQFDLRDYLPLAPGNAWTFETIVRTRNKVLDRCEDTWRVEGRAAADAHDGCCRGTRATRITMDATDTFAATGRLPALYLALDGDGLTLYGNDTPDGDALPALSLPSVVRIGDGDAERTAIVGPIRPDGEGGCSRGAAARPWYTELRVESCDRVITPAGLFSDCLQLSVTCRESRNEQRKIMEWRVWLAKDVGPVVSTLTCEWYPAAKGPCIIEEQLVRAMVDDWTIER